MIGGSVAAATGAFADSDNADRHAEVRNVIYLLGDGMGRTHITAGRQRFYGANGKLNMEKLPFTGADSTYAVEKGTDKPSLVNDSASSATAWSSGVKTYNAAPAVDPQEN